jgi:hypothetical protein
MLIDFQHCSGDRSTKRRIHVNPLAVASVDECTGWRKDSDKIAVLNMINGEQIIVFDDDRTAVMRINHGFYRREENEGPLAYRREHQATLFEKYDNREEEDHTKYSCAFASWWWDFSLRWRDSGNDYAAVLWGAKAGWDGRGRDILPLIEHGLGISDLRKHIGATNSVPASPQSPPSASNGPDNGRSAGG